MSRLSPALGFNQAHVADPTAVTAAAAAVTSVGAADDAVAGITAGAYDDAANRDLFIASMDAFKVDVASFDVEMVDLADDVAIIRGKIDEIRTVLANLNVFVKGDA